MIWYVLCIMFSVFSLIAIRTDHLFAWVDFMAYVCGLLFIIVSAVASMQFAEVQYGTITYDIVSMKNNVSSEVSGGGSFLGWRINSSYVEQYVIMEKYHDGSHRKRYLKCDETYIIEYDADIISPHVEYQRMKYVTTPISPPWTKLYIDKLNTWFVTENARIYVPRGTIIQKIDNI